MSRLKAAAAFVVAVLRREPVAVWGVVAAAGLGVLTAAGVPARDVSLVGTLLPLLGVPVVRRKVTPTAALKALVSRKA